MSEATHKIDVTPAMVAAAWDAWSPRHRRAPRLGPGPGLVEAIRAALAASRTDQEEVGDHGQA